jgi:hypothetical protein
MFGAATSVVHGLRHSLRFHDYDLNDMYDFCGLDNNQPNVLGTTDP